MRGNIVILSGSGLSAESGLPTFRDAAGLWRQHSWQDLASPEGWRANPALVLEFYNERRAKAWSAQPNAAHLAIAALERKYDVVVVTQNVDALHERAGSTNVLPGEIAPIKIPHTNEIGTLSSKPGKPCPNAPGIGDTVRCFSGEGPNNPVKYW